MYSGNRVRAVIKVIKADRGAGSVIGLSTDGHELFLSGHPGGDLTTFVEVIGIAEPSANRLSIRPEIWTNFGDDFGNFILFCLQFANAYYLFDSLSRLQSNLIFPISCPLLYLFSLLYPNQKHEI